MPSKPRKPGRPPLGKGRGRDGAIIAARVTAEEKRKIRRHLEREGLTESELIRARLVDVLYGP